MNDFADQRMKEFACQDARDRAMKRIALCLLMLCAGCASPGEESLLEDGLWGDVETLFMGKNTSADDAAPAPSSPYNSSSFVTIKRAPAETNP